MGTAETWFEITDWPDYEVSDHGNVRSWKGRGKARADQPMLRSLTLNSYGYLVAQLYRGGWKHPVPVHKLVLTAFSGPRPAGMHGCHNNGVKTDNRLSNLRWGTPKSNEADKDLHGTSTRGERHHAARLTAVDVAAIRAHRGFLTGRHLSEIFGVNPGHISAIQTGRNWGGHASSR
jgi:hypothetical protein